MKITQASLQDDSLVTLHRRAAARRTVPRQPAGAADCRSPRCSPTCAPRRSSRAAVAQFGVPRRAWSSSAPASIRSSCSTHFDASYPQDRPQLHAGPGRPARATRRRSARSPPRRSELGKQTIAEYVQDAGSMTHPVQRRRRLRAGPLPRRRPDPRWITSSSKRRAPETKKPADRRAFSCVEPMALSASRRRAPCSSAHCAALRCAPPAADGSSAGAAGRGRPRR